VNGALVVDLAPLAVAGHSRSLPRLSHAGGRWFDPSRAHQGVSDEQPEEIGSKADIEQ
jgi:hypothetical protein